MNPMYTLQQVLLNWILHTHPKRTYAFFWSLTLLLSRYGLLKKKKKKRVLGSQLLLQSLSLMLCLNMYADAFLRSCRLLTAGLRPETNPPNSPVSFLTIRYPVFTFLMPWGRSLKRPEKHDLLFSWYFHHTSTMGRFCLGFPYMLRKNKTTTENKIKMWISHIRPHN